MKHLNKQITACGRLEYSDYAQYQIITSNGVTNISEILDKIYYSTNNKIKIKIMNGSKTLYNEEGNLLKKPGDYGIYDYHINGYDLEQVLFDYTGKNIDIEIVADAESLGQGEVEYGTDTYEARQVAK